MSTFFKESNLESTRMLYSKGVIYSGATNKYLAVNNSKSAVVDFNFAEKYLYGRVSRHFVPIVLVAPSKRSPPNSRGSLFKTFNKVADVGDLKQHMAINFVVDAFNDLERQFRKCAAKGLIDAGDKHLSRLVVHKAYVDPLAEYTKYRTGVLNGIARTLSGKANIQIMNGDQFIDVLKPVVETIAMTTPYSLPAFVKSRRCPMNVSGLVVEIANIRSDNDEDKMNMFYNSKNWEFYLNACRTYGFMVDRNNPWRLVADLGSSAMMKYAAKYGSGYTDYVLETYYRSAHHVYYSNNQIKRDLLTLYNMVIPPVYFETESHNDGTTVSRTKTPQRYSSTTEFLSSLRKNSLPELYFNIRVWEEETNLNASHVESLKKDFLGVKGKQAPDTKIAIVPSGFSSMDALSAFERIINRPFDYRGSLTYNINVHLPARRKNNNDDPTSNSSGGGY